MGKDVQSRSVPTITIGEIQQRVAESFGTSLVMMMAHRRHRSVARARQVAMYLARQMTPEKLSYIAHKFGDRDRTTITHGIQRIQGLMAADPDFAAFVTRIQISLMEPVHAM
jgi:chromosomal replication initiator protein